MQTFVLMLVVSGLAVLHAAQGHDRCRYARVVHRDGGSRYSLTFQQAQQLCQSSYYNLATEEQLRKAYEQGLKTCRYGWIDGQRVSVLPHTADPNCSLSTAVIGSHAEAPDSLYDVYCFIPPEIDCEDASTSSPHASFSNWPTQESITTNAKPNQDEDVLGEVMADGFIVDIKGTTLAVQNQKSQDNYQTATSPNAVNVKENPSLNPQEDTVPTVVKYPDVMSVNLEVDTELATGNHKEASNKGATMLTTIHDFVVNEMNTPTELTTKEAMDETENTNMEETISKGTTKQTTFSNFGHHEIITQTELTSKEIVDKAEHLIMESSGMIPDLHEKASRHFAIPTAVHMPGGILGSSTPLLLLSEEAGSGMEPEKAISTDPISNKDAHMFSNRRLVPQSETTREPSHVRNVPSPTAYLLAETGTPAWLIIFAFCLTLGAILCILVGIATKDKWYRHKRGSLDITPRGNTEDGLTVTLPSVEKEQEMVTLMSTEKVQNEGDFSIISLEEPPEKEYLM